MRDFQTIQSFILSKAISDSRIRAILLSGSRANPDITPDSFQDYDLTYFVSDFQSFISDHSWTNIFGDKISWQLPEEMSFGEKSKISFTYLILLKDGNRKDLTLFPLDKFKSHFKRDSQTIIWLDKDDLFPDIGESSDRDYWIKKPSEKEFLDTCNEFWWVSTYVAKGLKRNAITYVKEMAETAIRPMMMKMIEWYIGMDHDFAVSMGKAGKNIQKCMSHSLYQRILNTYSDHHVDHNRQALFEMTDIFTELSGAVANRMKFNIDLDQERNTMDYLRRCLNIQIKNFQRNNIGFITAS